MSASLLLSVISLCLCVSGFFFCRWYIVKKTAANELLERYRDEVNRLIAEIDAATDRDSLLVEDRIKTLRRLIDDTDRRISVYIREIQRNRSGDAMYTSLGRGIRAALDSRPPAAQGQASSAELASPAESELPLFPADIVESISQNAEKTPAPRKRGSRKNQTQPAAQAKPAKPKEPASQTPPANVAAQGAQRTKPKIKVQIAEMSAQGLSPSEIASRLGISLAEVDLALNLLQRSMHK